MTMEDVKDIQVRAAAAKENLSNPRRKAVKKKTELVVKSGNTELAKALAAAMKNGQVSDNIQIDRDIPEDKSLLLSTKIKDTKRLAEELGIGEITLIDIIKELEKPGRDPRDDMPKPIFRTDVLEISDLREGMILKGTVRNVLDFGAFVDIGVHQDGLVHISQMTNKKFVKHPLDVVSVGDIVDVKVIGVDVAKNRIQLSMIL